MTDIIEKQILRNKSEEEQGNLQIQNTRDKYAKELLEGLGEEIKEYVDMPIEKKRFPIWKRILIRLNKTL